MTYPNCKINAIPSTRQVTPVVVPNKPNSVARTQMELMTRIGMLHELDLSKSGNKALVAERMLSLVEQNYFETLMAKRVHLNPSSMKGFQSWLVRHFPSFADQNKSPAKIRRFLVDADYAGQNFFDVLPIYAKDVGEAMGKLEFAGEIADAYKTFSTTLKQMGLSLSKADIEKLWIRSVESGQQPRVAAKTGIGEWGLKELEYRYENTRELYRSFGIGEDGIDTLLSLPQRAIAVHDEILAIAKTFGADIDKLEGIGYFNRTFSSDFKFRLRAEKNDLYSSFVKNPAAGFEAAIQKSRQTNEFIVEDELMLAVSLGIIDKDTVKNLKRNSNSVVSQSLKDELSSAGREVRYVTDKLNEARKSWTDGVRAGLPQRELKLRTKLVSSLEKKLEKANKAYDLAQKNVGESSAKIVNAQQKFETLTDGALEKLNSYITDGRKLNTAIAEMDDATLNSLVDSGVLSKLPMLTDDTFEIFKQKFNLPYKGLNELMLTDPVRAFKAYETQLKELMGKATMTRSMFKDAVEYGWGVTEAMKAREPGKFGDFVKLNLQIYKKFGVSDIPGADKIYLHPRVADIYSSILEVSTDPVQLGTLASVWQWLNRVAKKQMVGTIGNVFRNLYQGFISYGAAGGNFAHLIPAMVDNFRFMKNGLAAFDDTKKVYRVGNSSLTEREMVAEMMKRDEFNQVVPFSGDVIKATDSFSAIDPRNAKRALGYWGSIVTGRGAFPKIKDGRVQWEAVEYGGRLVEGFTNEAYGKILSLSVFLENAYKLALYRTIIKRENDLPNRIGQFLTTGQVRRFADIDDAVKHTRDYFFDYRDVGVGDKLISKNGIPFWIYQSRNLPAAVRHMARNPAQYMAYQRLYSLMNEPVREGGDAAPEGGFPDYMQGTGNLYFKHPDGTPNKFLHIPFNKIDPIADATDQLENGFEGIANLFGIKDTGSTDEKLNQVKSSKTSTFLDGWISQSYPLVKVAAGLIKGKDALGRPLQQDDTKTTSLLGVEIPGTYAPAIKFMLESTFPYIGHLNRWNPGNSFGIKEKKDQFGRVTREASPSLFGVPRSDSDSSKTDEGKVAWVDFLRGTGVTVDVVDSALNMGYTQAELEKAAKDMKKTYSALKKKAKENPDDQKVQRALRMTEALYVELHNGNVRAGRWMQKNGYPTNTSKYKEKRRVEKIQDSINSLNEHDKELVRQYAPKLLDYGSSDSTKRN